MSENKTKYSEYVLLGINKALTAFLLSAVICLGIAGVINHKFYEQIVMITIGSLGEVGKASGSTILKTAGLFLGLSNFHASGKFQLGLLVLGMIPLLSFVVAGFLFRTKEKEEKPELFSCMIIDGLAATIYSVFLMISAWLTKGELFGWNVNFLSLRNFVFSIVFLLFLQFLLGINRTKRFSMFASGIAGVRSLIQVVFGFSALTGALFILYYLSPYLKTVSKMAGFVFVALPNLAVLLSFVLMGVPINLNRSLGKIGSYVNIDMSFLQIPLEIHYLLILTFMVIVLLALLGFPQKKSYWLNLLVYATGFGISMMIFAIATRIDLGFVQGALNIYFAISPLLAFGVPFVIIILEGLLLYLVRAFLNAFKDVFGLDLESEPETEETAINPEQVKEDDAPKNSIKKGKSLMVKLGLDLDYEPEEEAQIYPKEIKDDDIAKEDRMAVMEWEEIRREVDKITSNDKTEQASDWQEPIEEKTEPEAKRTEEKEVDILLFPKKRKPFERIMDFSEIEDDEFLDDYEAEETLDGFEDKEPEMDEQDKTIIVQRKEAEMDLEKTIPYRMGKGVDLGDTKH